MGLASAIGSVGWFTAFTLQIAAYVRTLGLVELVFTLLISLYAFRERPGRFEMIGLGLLILSIALVLNGGREKGPRREGHPLGPFPMAPARARNM